MARVENGVEVDGDHLLPLLDCRFDRVPETANPRIVEEDVDPAMELHGFINKGADIVHAGNVRSDEMDVRAAELAHHGRACIGVDVGEDELCPFLCKKASGGRPDTGRTPGDDRDAAGKTVSHLNVLSENEGHAWLGGISDAQASRREATVPAIFDQMPADFARKSMSKSSAWRNSRTSTPSGPGV